MSDFSLVKLAAVMNWTRNVLCNRISLESSWKKKKKKYVENVTLTVDSVAATPNIK